MEETRFGARVRLRRRRFLQAAAAAASTLGLAACSGAATPAAGPTAPAAAPTGATAGNPITIGVAISTTGSNGDTGTYQQQGYQMWEETVNAGGGLLGRPVKFLFYDDQSDPTTSSRLYEKLITQDKVDLVLGPYASNVSAAVAQVVERYRYPMIAVGAAASEIWQKGYKYVFGLASTTDLQYGTLVQEVIGPLGYKRVALIYQDSLFPISEINGAKEYLKKIDAQAVLDEKYPPSATDLSSVLTHVRDANPDVVLGGTYTPDSELIIRQARELGVNPKLWGLTVGPGDPNFVANLGADANWVTVPLVWDSVINTPGNAEFVQRYESKYQRPVDYHVATGYAGGTVLAEAVKQAGSLDRDKIRDALASLRMTTLLPGEYHVDETGAQIGHVMLAVQIQNGKRVVLAPKELATGAVQAPTPPWNER
jgi:branched-chain amino acid transport system substrate-binding protein